MTDGEGKQELDAMNAEAPLLGLLRADTGEQGEKTGKWIHFRGKCPVCGHNDCFRFDTEANTCVCFSKSAGELCKKPLDYVGYLKAAYGINNAEAVAELRRVTGHPYDSKALAKSGAVKVQARAVVKLDRSKNGAPFKSQYNVCQVLRCDEGLSGCLQRNLLTRRVEVAAPLPWGRDKACKPEESGFWDYGYDTFKLIERCYTAHRFEPNEKIANNAVSLVAGDNSYDPVMLVLEQLPRWDGERHAENLLTDFLGADDSGYTKALSALMVAAIVERQFSPGCKFDHMVVLVGAQGLGKSTFCRLLALSDALFTDQVQTLDSDSKESLQKLSGKTVIEIGELNGMKSAKSAEKTKAFITAQVDSYRTPYARHVDDHPRRCVLIGTTNEAAFLQDKTGNRRFLVVRCGAQKPTRSLWSKEAKAEFEQAYAQMVAKRKECGRLDLTLPETFKRDAKEAQEAALMEDPYAEPVRLWLEGLDSGTLVCSSMVTEQALGVEKSASNYRIVVRQVQNLLDTMDCVERLPGKKRVSGYSNAATVWRVK